MFVLENQNTDWSSPWFSLVIQDDGLSERQSVFAILRQAELVPATVNDYREKLLHLRKLRHDVVQAAVPDGPLQEVKIVFPFFFSLLIHALNPILGSIPSSHQNNNNNLKIIREIPSSLRCFELNSSASFFSSRNNLVFSVSGVSHCTWSC